MDFTIKTYKSLLNSLKDHDFIFQTFQEYIESYKGLASPSEPVPSHREDTGASAGKDKQKTIILRHDVDKLPENSLRFAQIQHALGIKGTYFFRIVPESYDPKIIEEIAALGHEIGYHYEDVDLVQSLKF